MNIGQAIVAIAVSFCCTLAFSAATTLTTLTLGQDTAGIVTDPALRKAFVTNYTTGTLSVISLDTLSVTATIAVGQNPRRLLNDAAHSLVYLVNDTTPGSLTVVNTKTNAVIAVIPVGNRPRTLAADFSIGEIYVSNQSSNTISIVSAATNTVVANVPVGTAPASPDVNQTLGKIYVPSGSDNTVSAIDQRTRSVKTIAVGKNPSFARVGERTGKVYVNNVDDNTVSIIDSTTDTVIKTLPVGRGSTFANASGVYRRIYLPNATDNTLTIIDGDTLAVARTVAVGASPQDAIIDSNGGDVYVVNQGGNSVTILNAATETVTGTLPVGTAPWRAATSTGDLLVLNVNGAALDSVTVATTQNTLAGTAVATDFYHAGFDHYFHSADPVETRLISDGLFANNWNSTFKYWRVWTVAGPGRMPVCRFFSATFAPKSSHFFTPYPAECASLQQGSVWQYEGTVYYIALPDGAGNCAAGTAPLYRLYNNGMGGAPNHRYTADLAVRDQMRAAGWIGEGSGPNIVFACTPSLLAG